MKPSLIVLVSLGCTAAAGAAEPTNAAAAALEECRDRVMDYAYYWDHGDTEGLSDVFTEDATLKLGGETFSGQKAIVERMARSAPGPEIRHLMSTVRITGSADGGASGVSYVTVYMAPAPDQGLPEVDGFALIGEYHDEFRITPDGCRIAARTLVPVFRQKR